MLPILLEGAHLWFPGRLCCMIWFLDQLLTVVDTSSNFCRMKPLALVVPTFCPQRSHPLIHRVSAVLHKKGLKEDDWTIFSGKLRSRTLSEKSICAGPDDFVSCSTSNSVLEGESWMTFQTMRENMSYWDLWWIWRPLSSQLCFFVPPLITTLIFKYVLYQESF